MTTPNYRVESLGSQGDGLVRKGEEAIHLSRVLPGERVELAGDRLARVVTPSPDRIEAMCKHFATCGGCKLQHWADAPYRAWKRDRVVNSLRRQNISVEVDELVDAHGEGRRRVTLHVREIDGTWRAGFMQQKSHQLAAIDQCPILVPALARACEIAAAFGPVLGPCDVAITVASNGLDVAVKAERSAVARRLPVLVSLFNAFGLLRLSVNGETITATALPCVDIDGVSAGLPHNAFLQATAKGEGELAARVVKFLAKSRNIADLFCGVGTFALRLAKSAPVFAVDSDASAVTCLVETVQRAQKLKPIRTDSRNLYTSPLVPPELKEFDGVVLDPPRAGAEAQVRNLARSTVTRIAYVSCDPDSFARDAKALCDAGFTLENVSPVDQFKFSHHVEIVGCFSRKNARR
jgi:23S rRNA (uracil1939-C5)-methyltransferase